MGIIRKLTSISTLGVVSYRNSGEKTAKVAKQTRNAARANVVQNMQLIELQRQQLAAAANAQVLQATHIAATIHTAQPVRQGPPALPPGWYKDPSDERALTWWDGIGWDPDTKHYPAR